MCDMCDNWDGSDGIGEGNAGIGRTGVGWVNVGVYESVDWFITQLLHYHLLAHFLYNQL